MSQGIYIQLFDEETPIFISMTQVELEHFGDYFGADENFLYVKTQEIEKYYNFKNIKEITIQGAN